MKTQAKSDLCETCGSFKNIKIILIRVSIIIIYIRNKIYDLLPNVIQQEREQMFCTTRKYETFIARYLAFVSKQNSLCTSTCSVLVILLDFKSIRRMEISLSFLDRPFNLFVSSSSVFNCIPLFKSFFHSI